MFLHILRHIQPNQSIHAVEHIACQLLYQLSFTNTGRTHKNEGNRSFFRADTHPIAPDSSGNRIHSLILTNNVGFQPVRQSLDLLILLRLDLGRRNLRPHFNNTRQVLHGHGRLRHGFQRFNPGRKLHQLAAKQSQTFKILIPGILAQHPQLQFIIIPLFF